VAAELEQAPVLPLFGMGFNPELMERGLPRSRQRICLQHQALKLDINLLVRRGLITPGSTTGPHAIRWVNSDGEVIASGWISADMEGDTEGFFAFGLMSSSSGSPLLPCPAILAVDSGSLSAR
jgi:hypothetical protein